jgi:hypothetical protein
MRTPPEVGDATPNGRTPPIMRITVDLPHPDGPSNMTMDGPSRRSVSGSTTRTIDPSGCGKSWVIASSSMTAGALLIRSPMGTSGA